MTRMLLIPHLYGHPIRWGLTGLLSCNGLTHVQCNENQACVCCSQGIELKEAGSNPLLGQYHMHNQQGFVKAKLEPIGRHANGNGAPAANGALSLLDDGTSAYG